MKICFVSHWSGSGGAEKILFEIIELCKANGVETVCVVPWKGSLYRKCRDLGVPSYVVPYRWWMGKDISFVKRVGRNVFNLVTPLAVARIIRKERCTVVHTNTSTIHVGALAAWLTGRPHVWHIHEYGYEHGGMTFDLGIRLSTKLIDVLSSRIITVSNGIRDKYKAYIRPEKIVTLYNPLEIRRDVVAEPRSDSGTFRIVIVGSLHKGKGQDQAILAVSRLVADGIKPELVIVGDGEDQAYKAHLTELVREHGLEQHVQWRGQLADPYPVMKSADCIAMCSQFEGFSMVVVEGMLLGRPVVAANSGSIPELIDHMSTGLTYEHSNVEELAERLKFVYRERDAAESMAARGCTWAARTFQRDLYYMTFSRLLAEARRDNPRQTTHEGVASGNGAGRSL